MVYFAQRNNFEKGEDHATFDLVFCSSFWVERSSLYKAVHDQDFAFYFDSGRLRMSMISLKRGFIKIIYDKKVELEYFTAHFIFGTLN